jgi:hypothetical protein
MAHAFIPRFLIFSLALWIQSCDLMYPSKKLIGAWDCVAWTIEGKPGTYDIARTNFKFKELDLYEATISGHQEKGAFYVEGDKLLTTAEGAEQVVTQIAKISVDTLILNLNRSGVAEQMVFVRKK